MHISYVVAGKSKSPFSEVEPEDDAPSQLGELCLRGPMVTPGAMAQASQIVVRRASAGMYWLRVV